MRNGKIFINLLLSIVVAILLAFVFITTKSPQEIIVGFVDDSKIDSHKKYKETLINNYQPEPDWQPNLKNNTSNQPEIVGREAVLVDIDTGDILYEKNSNSRAPIASLVKIMTAVVALEHKQLNEKVYITKMADRIGENTMQISEGEVYTLEELLYGLILHSGNDAAYAIAESVAGNSDRFVEWMNIKANEIGLIDTYFADPSGLSDETFSTPTDLIKLTRYALKNPKFREIVKTVEYEIYGGKTNKYIYLYNQTNLLTTYPGVAGVKTGFTEEAGLSLVTYAKNGGKEVVGVVLNSIDRKGDMILMLDHGYETLGIVVEHSLL